MSLLLQEWSGDAIDPHCWSTGSASLSSTGLPPGFAIWIWTPSGLRSTSPRKGVPGRAESNDERHDIADAEDDAVPTAGHPSAPSGIQRAPELPAAQEQIQVTARGRGRGGTGGQLERQAELLVEDRAIDIDS
jgi:hypothetical protein